jgi:hypothetical protein
MERSVLRLALLNDSFVPGSPYRSIHVYNRLRGREVDGRSERSMRKKAAGVRTTGKAGWHVNWQVRTRLSLRRRETKERGAHEVILVEAFAERDLPPDL